MDVRNNYQECLTNLACSIRKYFGLEYHHNTLAYIDELLREKQPKNVVVLLFDGMGSNILKRTLNENSFLRSHLWKEITTVFPATTTAATTSMKTGLNPVEHGFLGWNMYIKPLDEVIGLYTGKNKDTKEESVTFKKMQKKYFSPSTVTSECNGIDILPFGDCPYHGFDEMLGKVLEACQKPGTKYIYAYDEEPDHSMHKYGPDSKEAKRLIMERDKKVERLCQKLSDTIVFVVADHGHVKIDNIDLDDYPTLTSMLQRTTSSEPRAVSFQVKNGLKEKFKEEFLKEFGDYFKLYSRDEVVECGLYGDGKMHPLFLDALGDFLAIAVDKYALVWNDEKLVSHHAGYLDDEIYVPLIVIDKTRGKKG